MADFVTLASLDDMRNAGNIDARVTEGILTFYLRFASMFLKEAIGDTNYASAIAGSLTGFDNDKLRMSEALMAVGISLPALANPTAIVGTSRTTRVGVGGEVEVFSFTKEVKAMASHFLELGKSLIPADYIQDVDSFNSIWSATIMRVFPGLDETPTVAPIASADEETLKTDRGDFSVSSSS